MLLEISSHVRNSATGTQSRGGTSIFWSVLTVQSYDCHRISKDRHSDCAALSALMVVSPNYPALRPCKEIGSDHQNLEFRRLVGGGSKLPRHEAQASLRTRKARVWSAVACDRLRLAKLASPTLMPGTADPIPSHLLAAGAICCLPVGPFPSSFPVGELCPNRRRFARGRRVLRRPRFATIPVNER
jgi:hypothetical protein